MNVLHVIPAIAKRYGGPSVAAVEMCRALAATGVETTIACTDADGPDRLDLPLGIPAMYDGVRVIAFRCVASESYKYSPTLAAWLRAHVRDFDLVHIHAVMSHACVAAARACRDAGVPYILRTIGSLDEWSIGQKAAKKRVFMSLWGKGMLAGAAAVHATSPEEQRALEQAWGVNRTVVIPIGISWVGKMTGQAAASLPYVAVVSRLHPVKALDVLISAFARASQSRSEWRLKIAGDGDPSFVAGLRAAAAASGAGDRIDFLGWVDGDEKDRLLGQASLYAMTSHHENFGIALAEAMARGLPAIVTPGVQVASWVAAHEAGWLADCEEGALCAALETAMASPDERRRRGANARQLAAQWEWPVIAGRIRTMYDEIASGPAALTNHVSGAAAVGGAS